MNLCMTKWHRIIHMHCTNINFLILILWYSYIRCNHLEKLDEVYMGTLYYFCNSLNCIFCFLK